MRCVMLGVKFSQCVYTQTSWDPSWLFGVKYDEAIISEIDAPNDFHMVLQNRAYENEGSFTKTPRQNP